MSLVVLSPPSLWFYISLLITAATGLGPCHLAMPYPSTNIVLLSFNSVGFSFEHCLPKESFGALKELNKIPNFLLFPEK